MAVIYFPSCSVSLCYVAADPTELPLYLFSSVRQALAAQLASFHCRCLFAACHHRTEKLLLNLVVRSRFLSPSVLRFRRNLCCCSLTLASSVTRWLVVRACLDARSHALSHLLVHLNSVPVFSCLHQHLHYSCPACFIMSLLHVSYPGCFESRSVPALRGVLVFHSERHHWNWLDLESDELHLFVIFCHLSLFAVRDV